MDGWMDGTGNAHLDYNNKENVRTVLVYSLSFFLFVFFLFL